MESVSISSVSSEGALDSRGSIGRSASNSNAAAQSRIHMIRRPGQGDLIAEVTGRGRPVILIHGWAVDRRMWALQVPALKRRFKVITFDRRGFGQSTCPAGLEQELDDLDALLDHFKLDQAALIGMSQGGRIAMRYAATRPNRVTALVLQGAPLDGLAPPAFDPSIIPTARLASLMRAGNRGEMIQLLSDHVLMERDARSATARAALQAMLRDYRGEDLQMAPPVEQPLEDARMMLGQITAPTIVVTGSRETIWLRQVADFTARNIRGARRRVIRGGRHFVNMTHPTDYNRCVVDFLERITTPWSERALGIS
jgi:pimeloyl-[acyl-carrier protein] methyl ester esterase